jgi:hypothetical protein
MRIRFKHVIGLSILPLLLTFSLGAQPLPSLPAASGVVSGALPNGISYFLVSNPSSKGRADFALVQKGPAREDVSRTALAELPHFQGERPYQFLAKLGVGYDKFGYIRSTEASTTFFFHDVPVDQAAVRDTVLLLLFDISETCPYEQALIVCGDVDKSVMRERMNVFSMMVTPRERVPEPDPYEWKPSETPVVRFSQAAPQEEATLIVRYSSPRTPREAMNTAQPLVTELFAEELGGIVRERLERVFRDGGIPLAGVSSQYRGSDKGPGAELYSFSVTTAREDLLRATEAFGAVLGELDVHGASLREFQGAKDRFLSSLAPATASLSNGEWVDKCASAFLYGAGLADPAYVTSFFTSRNIASQRELELFNDFVSALLDPSKALTLRYVSPSRLDADSVKAAFAAGWSSASGMTAVREYGANQSDTLALYVPKTKAKLKQTVSEPVTGGELWTFANGMRVIYKRSTAVKGMFSYGFLLNGGFAGVPDLAQGEGGFIADMLTLNDIGGSTGASFLKMLESNGISFNPSVSLTDFRIAGRAPSSRLQLLLKSLLTLSRERALNADAYGYYRSGERLRLSMDRKQHDGIHAVVDSIMCPDFRYMAGKRPYGLSDDLPQRAAEYFKEIFSHCNDGVLVLVGDLDPYMLKKVLPKYMGGFMTGGMRSIRPQVEFNLRSGWSTYTVEAGDSVAGSGEPCITVAESAVLPFTPERYYSFRVAAMELRKHLAGALAGTGMYAEVSDELELFPVERLSLRIVCRPAAEEGLPADIVPEDPLRVLGVLRSALAGFSSDGPSASSVAASKSALQSVLDASMSDSDFLADAAMMRYSVGKDMVTGYKSKVGAVTPASVKEILSALDSGSKVEFVVY